MTGLSADTPENLMSTVYCHSTKSPRDVIINSQALSTSVTVTETETAYTLLANKQLLQHEKKVERTYTYVNYTKLISLLICAIVLFSGAVMFSRKEDGHAGDSNPVTALNSSFTAVSSSVSSSIDADGFVFGESNQRVLTKDEIMDLENRTDYDMKTLLNLAINEIYARNGQKFKEGELFSEHFNNYEWYKKLEKKRVTFNDFNEFEWENVNQLVDISKKLGFR